MNSFIYNYLLILQIDGKEIKQGVVVQSHLTLINIDIIFMHFFISDHLVITFVNCTVINTDIWSRGVKSIHLQVVNSTFRGHVNSTCLDDLYCRTTTYIDAYGKNVSLWYKDSTFYQTFSVVRAGYADKVAMHWRFPVIQTVCHVGI